MGVKLVRILSKILMEQEESSSSMDDILNRFKVLRIVLQDLLTSSTEDDYSRLDDLSKLITDIKIIVFKPTTFQIKFKNGSQMNLKYIPTPQELNPEDKDDYKPRDYFQCQITGKKYSLGNRSEYLQALDNIGRILSQAPIGSGNNQSTKDQDAAPEEPEAGSDDADNDKEEDED